MVELKGSLSGIGLPAIVQLIGELHHSGFLQLRNEQTTAQLTFDDGHLVGAQCGEAHGVEAITLCTTQLGNAEFTFVEGTPAPERNLDLSPADVKRLLGTVPNGHHAVAPNGSNTTILTAELACPLLGFADDRTRHYGRPTALHRCFATGAPGLVTPTEQRELCLSGKFSTCARYRTADQARLAQDTGETEIQPRPTARPPASPMPPGVAARLAAASQMSAGSTPNAPEPATRPAEVGKAPPARASQAKGSPAQSGPASPSRRPLRGRLGVLPVAGGAAIGLLLVALILFVAVPAISGRVGQRPAPNTVAFEPVATATSLPTPLAIATPVSAPTAVRAVAAPTFPPTPTALPRLPTPTTPPVPTAVPLNKQLADVRFAAGPADGWIDNAPYASWSDGAYRLQAHDAARFVAVSAPLNQVFTDVSVSATFRKTGGPPGGGYGLIVRAQSDQPLDGVSQDLSGYVLETGDLGEYGVWRREGDHWVDLVPWTHSSSVRSGGSPNDLSVTAVGSHITFTVNGTVLATVDDDALVSGRIALFIGGDYNEVALDHFSVELP